MNLPPMHLATYVYPPERTETIYVLVARLADGRCVHQCLVVPHVARDLCAAGPKAYLAWAHERAERELARYIIAWDLAAYLEAR